MKRRVLSIVVTIIMLIGMLPMGLVWADEAPLTVTDNVIDITDRNIWSWSKYYAKAVDIRIAGADVQEATEDGTNVNIVLSGTTAPDAEILVEFGTSLNKAKMSGHTSSVVLSNGEAQVVMTLKGEYSSAGALNNSVTYTINFSLSPTEVPECVRYTDNVSVYCGVKTEFDMREYFRGAKTYYLVDGEEKTALDGSSYTFMTLDGGTYTLVFSASNDNGDCTDLVTVTVEATEIKSGAYLGITTSNGSVNHVMFTDADGREIDGLTAYLDGNTIKVSVPRTYAADGKITATFDLTQNNGYPKLSTTNSFNRINDTKIYAATLKSGTGQVTAYLYNAKPGAISNNYTAYTISYAIANEVPVLAKGQESTSTSSMTADKAYTIDLDGIFADPDDDDSITGWLVSVDGKEPVDAVVDENNVYTYQTVVNGEHILEFYGRDNYNAVSSEKYTVTLTVYNSTDTYDVTVTIQGTDGTPTFYCTSDAKEGTELTTSAEGNVYTVKVPVNVSVISWRADGVGMCAPVSDENNDIVIIKPAFTVKAGDEIDGNASVTLTHSSLNVSGSQNNYLLLGGEKYNITATPSVDYEAKWKEGKLENYTLSDTSVEISLVSKGTVFTYPYFAILTVSEASQVQGIAPKEVLPVKTTDTDFASGTKTATYELANGKVYEYRVSVPEDNINCNQYVTYVATFTKNDAQGITITKEQIESGDKGRTTLDRNAESNRGRNVADIYTNVNAKGYKKLGVGDTFNLIATRNYRGVNADWLMNGNYYYAEPDFHYTVIDEDGLESHDVITVDKSGKITAVGEGSAIVMITYDAMTLNHEAGLSAGALGDYMSAPNDFYGAIWPENTGVFVVTVGADDSGFTTGMTINEDKATGQKASGKYIDAELDVIYYTGEKGKYTFTPATDGVSVFVSNPTVTDTTISFDGFEAVAPNEDGSITVPLTTGRNIVKLTKDGKSEYQVITAKKVNVTVNGEPLESATVSPGQKIKIEFDNLFAPVNRMAIYNTSCAVVYSRVSGYEGKMAGNTRGSMGEYTFSSNPAKRTVENFVSASLDGSGYSNSQVTSSGELTVPEDFEKEYFTLSNGSFNVGGFMPYLLGSHYEKLGIIPPNNTTSDNINCYLGTLPDISIPVSDGDGGNIGGDNEEDSEDNGEDDSDNIGSDSGNNGGGFSDKYDSIKVYMTFVKGDSIVVQNERITVYDKDKDGKYSIGDAFRALHRERYSGGESGYKEISGGGVNGWVSKFWGSSDTTFAYAKNYSWAKSTEDTIEDGDTISAIIGKDGEFYSDLFTWFDDDSYSAKVNTDITLRVNGLNLMASTANHDALHAPNGATVTVYGKNGNELKDMATSVDKDGKFNLSFSDEGTYTVKVSGKAKWGSYNDAPVAPTTCKVTVSSTGGGSSVNKKDKNTQSEDNNEEENGENIAKENKKEFTDAKGHWGEEYIDFVAERGLYDGVGDGKFGVDDAMTRAMLVCVLYRLADNPDTYADSSFADVNDGMWYTDAVSWANANGIANGVDDKNFNPDGEVTREQTATILYRYFKHIDIPARSYGDLDNFCDSDKVSPWANDALKWAVGEGIITGRPNNILDPKGDATRTEVAVMLMRFITNMEE